jgi:hypothetical protein
MNRSTIALLTATFAGTFAGAATGEIYQGWARDNPDLDPQGLAAYSAQGSQKTGVQPGVGDIGMSAVSKGRGAAMQYEPEPYRHDHSLASGNGDLYPEGFR